MNDLICPTDRVLINETRARLVAALVLLTVVGYVITASPALLWFLLLDFGLRAFKQAEYSPLWNVAGAMAMYLPTRLTDAAPKRFAASVGLAFAATLLVLRYVALDTFVLSGVLAAFAALEALAGFCAGCYVYTYYVRWFRPRA